MLRLYNDDELLRVIDSGGHRARIYSLAPHQGRPDRGVAIAVDAPDGEQWRERAFVILHPRALPALVAAIAGEVARNDHRRLDRAQERHAANEAAERHDDERIDQ